MRSNSTHGNPQADNRDDDHLVSGIRSREERALVALMRVYGRQVQGICELIVQDPIEADSVASDVFFELWSKPNRFDPDRGTIRAYLMTLARSRAIDRLRQRKAKATGLQPTEGQFELEVDLASDGPAASLQRKERRAAIQQALARLPASTQAALKLAFFSGLSHQQIADHSKIPLGTVKTRVRTGLLKLRNMLKVDFGEEELNETC
ncbi:MAG: sigma-70 family RNA polymerase sigma factor [Aureliella sp.]